MQKMSLETAKNKAAMNKALFDSSLYEIQLLRLYELLLHRFGKIKNSVITVSDIYVLNAIPEPYADTYLALAEYIADFEYNKGFYSLLELTPELVSLADLVKVKLNNDNRRYSFKN